MIEFTYKPDWPWLVTGGLVVAGALYWSYRAARGQANQKHRWLLFALRCVTIAVVIVCLLDPQRVKEIKRFQPGYTAVLLDLSRSMTWKDDDQTRIDAAKRWIQDQLAAPSSFAVRVYGFSSNLVTLPTPDTAAPTQRTAGHRCGGCANQKPDTAPVRGAANRHLARAGVCGQDRAVAGHQ